MISKDWLNLPETVTLKDNEIHISLCRISNDKPLINILEKYLSIDELEKANKFVFEKDRLSYIVSRGTLRTLLVKYLNISPQLIRFSYNQYGKPFIDIPQSTDIKFNLSHSNEYCLIAINKNSNIGIDIEWINKDIMPNDIAKNYFSASELKDFSSINKENQLRAFFKIWTRKEAFIKAVGKGLSLSLDSFDVSLDDVNPKIKQVWDKINYQLSNLNISNNYCASIVYTGRIKMLTKYLIRNYL